MAKVTQSLNRTEGMSLSGNYTFEITDNGVWLEGETLDGETVCHFDTWHEIFSHIMRNNMR